MNIIDKTIELFSPEAALRRDTARKILDAQRAYEAAQPSKPFNCGAADQPAAGEKSKPMRDLVMLF